MYKLLLTIILLVTPCFAANLADWQGLDRSIGENGQRVLDQAREDLARATRSGDEGAELDALYRLTRATYIVGANQGDSTNGRGLTLARKAGNAAVECWFVFLKGEKKMLDRAYGEADALFNEAGALAERNHVWPCGFDVPLNKGYLLQVQSRYSEAMDWYSRGYELARARGDRLRMATSLQYIGSLYNRGPWSSPQDLAKAAEYLQRSLALIDPDMYRSFAAYIYENLGLTYYRLKDYPQARRMLQKAIAAGAYSSGRLEFRLGLVAKDEGHYTEALEYLNKAIPLLPRFHNNIFLAQALLAKAEVLARLGRGKESLELLAQATAAGQQVKVASHNVYHHERAAEIHALLGDHQQAFRHMGLLREAERRLTESTNARQVDELKVRFDVQMKEAENAQLRAERKAAETRRVALLLVLAITLLVLGGLAFWMRKRAAIARREALHNKQLAEAEMAANKAKSTFLANMSHELRSPLNAMLGFTRLLRRDDRLPDDAREDLGIVVRSGEHLYTLINQVLDLSKIEAVHPKLEERNVDFYELLDELGEMFALAARQKGLQLSVVSQPDVPKYICVDAVKLRQVLINLLSNAIKFTMRGSVRLQVAAMRNGPDCNLSCAVIDTGPGIAPDELDQLGNAFVQAQAGRESHEGTGLGLAISRSYVKLMGGQLKVSSELGQGTTFSFDISVKVGPSAGIAAPIDIRRRVTGLAPGQPRYRVLAVDDGEEGRKLLVRLLTPLGFEVREAGDGREAVSTWEQWQPQLILMDMRMPVMDGREATRRIRSIEKATHTAIIALTASSFEEDRDQILAHGCDDFLRKPFREEVLLEMIRKHLELRFTYDETAAAPALEQTKPAAMTSLPPELAAQLKRVLADLDANAIERLIGTIGEHDADLARMLADMADRYEYEGILALLNRPDTIPAPSSSADA